MTKVVIVESPAKAKTINKYLGSEYQVLASYGHVRDLPSKNGSVKPEEGFSMSYEVSAGSIKHLKNISNAVKKSDALYLATDPDREGEAISWHVVEALKESKSIKKGTVVKRVVFHEITKSKILEAMQNPRDIDMHLVDAQQARRALDYLVGFTLSPVLWRKLPGSRSAGRVQSVALRMICDRESEIEKFISREYWDIKLNLLTNTQEKFSAQLTHFAGHKLEKFDIASESAAKEIVTKLQQYNFSIENIEKRQIKRNPQAAFTTSSLQQEASRKLGFSTKHTMQLAQKLYEGVDVGGESVGLITYMRTDSVNISQEAISNIRGLIKSKYGEKYVPPSPRIYKSKDKNAQEAHEAIRPTDAAKYVPDQLKNILPGELFKLYELIWKRAVASQMESAVLDVVSVTIASDDKSSKARASGSNIAFDGFYSLYREGLDDTADEEYRLLPKVATGEGLVTDKILPNQHFTEPPPRYTEASIVKSMEELGIGRPSTYASIISVLQDRKYVKLEKKRFIPENRGRIVTAFLVDFFSKYVEYDFTASLEDQLDGVSNGVVGWKDLLKRFWDPFIENVNKVSELKRSEILDAVGESLDHFLFPNRNDGESPRICPSCNKGTLSVKFGKFGAFIACSSYPECNYIKPLNDDNDIGSEKNEQLEEQDFVLGVDSASGVNISLKKGPYGHYVQLGEQEGKTKPKRVSIPAFIALENVNLAIAQSLLSLPKELGRHPDTNEPITIGLGKFGPYALHQGKYTSLPKTIDFLSISLTDALALVSKKSDRSETTQKKTSASPLKIIGKHPETQEDISLYSGRYGPYIKYAKLNISLPKSINIEELDLEKALELIANKSNPS